MGQVPRIWEAQRLFATDGNPYIGVDSEEFGITRAWSARGNRPNTLVFSRLAFRDEYGFSQGSDFPHDAVHGDLMLHPLV
jgi:hypothetical protein